MQTIRLQVSDRVYKKFLQSLSKIEGEDIRIINEDKEFQNHVAEAREDYLKLKNDESNIIDIEDFEKSVSSIL